MTRYVCTLMFLLVTFNVTYSQADTDFWNPTMREIADTSSQSGWIVFRSDVSIPPLGLFQDYKDAFGLTSDDKMVLRKTKSDSIGMSHYRFQQTYKGVNVLGGVYSIHAKNDVSQTGNGRVIGNLSVDITPSIDSATAILSAIQEVKKKEAEKFGVHPSTITLVFDSAHPYEAGLVISKLPSQIWELQSFRLVYRAKVKIDEPSDYVYYVFVDANSGVALETIPGVFYAQGQVTTLYNGHRTNVASKWTGSWTKYKLIDESRGDGITTRKNRSGPDQYVNDGDNDWDDTYKKRVHASTQWAGGTVWDYYLNTFGRNGPDGSGMALDILTNFPSSGNCPSNSCIPTSDPLEVNFVGAVSGACDPRISLNAVGHEFTHGVGFAEANWEPSTVSSWEEAYALMEGCCDIFGEMVEFDVQGWVDWRYDDQSLFNNACIRTFSPPILDGLSALEYGDANWNANSDGHLRGGVLRYWFFLLSVGGMEENHLGHDWCVEGIGIPSASTILYRTLNENHLDPSSTFATARNATILIARNEFGNNSNEVAQVTQAWYAVAVGPPWSGTIEYDNLTVSAPQTISHNSEIVFNNLQVTPTGDLTVTSNTRITVMPNSNAVIGSNLHLYIAPGCPGGAKVGGTNQ